MVVPQNFEQKYAPPVIGALSAYEALAIMSGKVPTISRGVWWLYRRWWGQAVLWSVWGWLTAHFFRSICEHDHTEMLDGDPA